MSPRTISILHVDDDDGFVRLVADGLGANQDAHVRHARNGRELLDQLRRIQSNPREAPLPDLILLELDLPGGDGREALLALKTEPALCAIPVVVLARAASPEDVAFCYRFGAASCVRKPSSKPLARELVATIGRYWLGVAELPDLDRALRQNFPRARATP